MRKHFISKPQQIVSFHVELVNGWHKAVTVRGGEAFALFRWKAEKSSFLPVGFPELLNARGLWAKLLKLRL
jgi:hypothetical protein